MVANNNNNKNSLSTFPLPVATRAGNLLPGSTDFTDFALKDKKTKLDTLSSKKINQIAEHSRFESLFPDYMENSTNNFLTEF